MRLRLTLVDPTGVRPAVELAVEAADGAAFADLAQALDLDREATDGAPPRWSADSAPLQDTDPLGRPPLLDGATLYRRRPLEPTANLAPSDTPAVLFLAVTSGPAAGSSWPLGPGQHQVGRSAHASVRVEDPDLSRVHVLIDVGATGVAVSDPGSTNGSRLDGRLLDVHPIAWSPGSRLHIGTTTLELRSRSGASAATSWDGLGHVLVNRPPRLSAADSITEIHLPPSPSERHRARIPWLTMVLPLLVAGPMAWLQHSPAYLLFGLMSPAMLLGNLVSDRRTGSRTHRQEQLAWRDAMTRAEADVAAALAAEGAARRQALPDCVEVLETARGPLTRLWERRPGDADALRLRIGLGAMPSTVRVVDPGEASAAVPQEIQDVPVSVDLIEAGVLGVAGSPDQLAGTARALLAQIAVWHSPRDVRLALLTSDDPLVDWSWASLLPHLRSDSPGHPHACVATTHRPDQMRRRITELIDLLDDRLTERRSAAAKAEVTVVVVIDRAHQLRSLAGLARLLEVGPQVGLHAICLDTDASLLPAECGAVVQLADPARDQSRSSVHHRGRPRIENVVADQVSAGWAERFARAMAPLRDATPEDTTAVVPREARLLDLLGEKAIDPLHLATGWRRTPRSTKAVIGVSATGPHPLDLRQDGPHILIGGTTGAGKSELLQTIIASLALANSPTHLGFVLVDYKGGSAFEECAQLPHTLGLVTDLDPHLTERALVSLRAELRRREALLRDAGAKDIDDYLARGGPETAVLPRLVLVLDEFRMLAEELPAFLDGMIRIAALGRSLGVHLVLATQRPAGIVSADISANVNLRIALRVRDQLDSEDVVESRLAATISERTPGRAYARAGSNPLMLFQTARVAGAEIISHPSACVVEVLDQASLGDSPASPALGLGQDRTGTPSDLARIVQATHAAARTLRLPATASPWLPPLPDVISVDELDRAPGHSCAPYAVVDRPEQQLQETLAWDLGRDAHLAVVGTVGSGRTSTLRTIAGSLATQLAPSQVHLHAIDGGSGGLLSLTRLPHAGVIAGTDELMRGVRLLDRLVEEISRRQTQWGTAGYGSLAEQHTQVDPADRLPYVVLLLDAWESLAAAWESVEHGRPVETLHRLIRDGAAVGLRVAITGDRGLLLSRLASGFTHKVVLRLADPTDLALAGVPAAAVPHRMPSGRGLRLSDHAEVQVALLSPDPSGSAQIAALDLIATTARRRCAERGRELHPPIRIQSLPAMVQLAPHHSPHHGAHDGPNRPPGTVLVGLGGDEAQPIELEIGSGALVAGPPGSGRSTALLTIGRQLAQQAEVAAVVAGHSPLRELEGTAGVLSVLDGHQATSLRPLLDHHPDCTVLVDDIEQLMDSEAEDLLLQWFKGPGRESGALVLAGSSVELAGLFRGLSVLARRFGQGILLNPTSYADGDLLGVRIGAAQPSDLVPGRGLLIRAGATTPIQVAC